MGGGTAVITASFDDCVAECSVTVIQPGVSVNKGSVSLFVGDGTTLSASVTPSGTSVTWSSDNNSVATVSGGKITAVGSGSTTIRAKITFGGKTYESSCKVSVSTPSVSISKSSASVYVGDSTSLSASSNPSGMSISWSSDNSSVATVNSGKVTGVGAGTTMIRAKISYGGKSYQASCEITVKKPSVSLSNESISLVIGQSKTLSATPSPSGASVTWSSSNSSVASVSGGKVTAVANGTATITAKVTYNGASASKTCTVTVTKPTITVTSDSSTITYAERESDRETCTLTAQVNPDGGKISWSSSNSSVATVSGDGKTAVVTAISSGTATITATYTVGGTTVSDTCTVNVEKAASTLRLEGFSYAASGTIDTFWASGTIRSNYPLTRVTGSGSATSPALLNITLSANATPYEFKNGVYEYDVANLRDFFY